MNPELSDGMAQRPLLTGSTLRLASVILDVFYTCGTEGERGEREREREREREMYIIIYIYIYIFIYLFIHSHKLTTPLTMFYKEVTSAGPQWGPGSYPVHRPEHLRSRSTSRSGAGTGGREVVPGWCSAPLFTCLTVYPLVNKQVAIENGPSIVDLPIKNGDFP